MVQKCCTNKKNIYIIFVAYFNVNRQKTRTNKFNIFFLLFSPIFYSRLF